MDLTRMTPHRWRRALHVTNVALAGLLVAAGVLVFTSGETAAARLDRSVRKDYERSRSTGLRWSPNVPVALDAMNDVVWRFRALRPAHWPYSGPLPPEPEAVEGRPRDAVETVDTLEQLGAVQIVAYDPDLGAAISFRFHATGKAPSFAPGEIIRAGDTEPARFRLEAVRPVAERVCHVRYAVLDEGGAVLETRTYVHDERTPPVTKAGPIRVAGDEDGARPKKAKARPPKPPARRIASHAVGRLEDLRPTVHRRKGNRRDRVLEFDAQTRDYFGKGGLSSLAKMVKTSRVEDARTGRTLGIRITGMPKALKGDVLGVRRGDTLVSINDEKVDSRDDAIRIASKLDPDGEDLVKLVVDRNGVLYTFRVDARDPRTKRPMRYFTWD